VTTFVGEKGPGGSGQELDSKVSMLSGGKTLKLFMKKREMNWGIPFLSSSALYWMTIVTINKKNPGVGLDEIGL
jgi:hypothetical protein